MFMICQDRTKCKAKSICRPKIVAAWKQEKRNLKYYLYKKLKGAYSNFIPLDLTEMVVSWENINLFE
jgi:hypothetical protein